MYRQFKKTIRKRLFVIDSFSLLLSFMIGMLVRYGNITSPFSWQNNIYFITLVLEILIYICIFFLSDSRKPCITELDTIENIVNVLKNAIILFAAVVGVLYLTQNGQSLSRLMLGFNAIFFCIIDSAFRLVYRRRKLWYLSVLNESKRTLLITESKYAEYLENRLRLEPGSGTIELLLTDREDERLNEKMSCRRAYLYEPVPFEGESGKRAERAIEKLSERAVRVSRIVSMCDMPAEKGMAEAAGPFAAVSIPVMRHCPVLGVNFAVSEVSSAAFYVRRHLDALRGKYITFCNVHTSVMSNNDEDYRKVQNRAALIFPDGAPIAKRQRKLEYADAKRVAGPDFMDAMFKSTMDGKVTHYFYGSTPATIKLLGEQLQKRYPGIVIKGLYSPPFRPLTEEEDEADIARINESGADFIWIGLGAPKQEKWMAAHEGKLHGVCLGVGAGFDFYAGTIRRAPAAVQKIGLEWLYRLFQDPKRLFSRYLVTNTEYFLLSFKEARANRGKKTQDSEEEKKAQG